MFAAAWAGPATAIDDLWTADPTTSPAFRLAGLLAAVLAIPAMTAVFVSSLQQGFRLKLRMPPRNQLARWRRLTSGVHHLRSANCSRS